MADDDVLGSIRRYRLRTDRAYLESACDAILASGASPPSPKAAPKPPTPKPSYLPPEILDRLNPLPNGHRRAATKR